MRASTFNLYVEIDHVWPKFVENRPAKGCAVCGAKPVLYTVGRLGWCKLHRDAAVQAAKESREP